MRRPFDPGRRSIAAVPRLLLAVPLAIGAGSIAPKFAGAQCSIQGVTHVDENQRFTLCGPGGDYRYRWWGPGVTNSNARCISVAGRPAGMYEYFLAIDGNGIERDRCSYTVTVEGGGVGGGTDRAPCDVVGPTEILPGATVELCGTRTAYDNHRYWWTGPGGFRADTRCVRVSRAGTYVLLARNETTGQESRCTHLVAAASARDADCFIRGPEVIASGQRARLCGPSTGDYTFRWRGPAGFLSRAACIEVVRPGAYVLTLRHRASGEVLECGHTIGAADDPSDIDLGNCPRPANWWLRVLEGRGSLLTAAEARTLARLVDQRSAALDWSDDLAGLIEILSPRGSMTRSQRATQQLATLLVNIVAHEHGFTGRRGQSLGLDPDTPMKLRSARTVGELAALMDRMLDRGTGNFDSVNRLALAVNRGEGIVVSCN